MPSRRQVPLPQQSAQLQPQAHPVDVYHDPLVTPPSSRNDLQDLGQALSIFEPSLAAFAEQQHKLDMGEGEKAAFTESRENNRKALKDATQQGSIAPGQNPWFRKGYRNQKARLAAEEYDASLKQAWTQSDVKNSDDPEAIGNFVQGFTSTFIKERGLDQSGTEFNTVFSPMAQSAQGQLFNIHSAHRVAAIEQEVEQNTDREISLMLDKGRNDGVPAEATAQRIHGVIQDQYLNGLDGTKSNLLVAGSVIQNAMDNLDPEALDVLDHIPSGSGTVGQISEIKARRAAAESHIYAALEHKTRADALAFKAAQDAAVLQNQRSVALKLLDDPSADINDERRNLSLISPEESNKVLGWQQAAINAKDNVLEDDGTVMSLTSATYNGAATEASIMDAQAAGKISKTTAKKLIEDLPRAKEFRSAVNDGTFKDVARSMNQAIKGNDLTFDTARGVMAQRAENQLRRGYIEFLSKNKGASELEKDKYLSEYSKVLTDMYAKEATDAAAETEAAHPQAVFYKDPEETDYKNKALFDEGSMGQAVLEYNQTQGKSGLLVDMAAHLGVTVNELIAAQGKVLQKPSAQAATPPKK